jgi:hypothetical protein
MRVDDSGELAVHSVLSLSQVPSKFHGAVFDAVSILTLVFC